MGSKIKPEFKNDKLTDSEKKKRKQQNKALANPKKADEKKVKNDLCREKRRESGSTKVIKR
jgi:hypothetical protein